MAKYGILEQFRDHRENGSRITGILCLLQEKESQPALDGIRTQTVRALTVLSFRALSYTVFLSASEESSTLQHSVILRERQRRI